MGKPFHILEEGTRQVSTSLGELQLEIWLEVAIANQQKLKSFITDLLE